MNLEDLSRMSEEELREKANEKLVPPSWETENGTKVELKPDLSAAQFFIDEIERRAGEAERKRQGRITTRDLLLELVVIVLIGGELYFGIHGGNQQLAVLQTLNTNASQQYDVYGTVKDWKSASSLRDGEKDPKQKCFKEWAGRAVITRRRPNQHGPSPSLTRMPQTLPSAGVMGGRLSHGATSPGPRVNGLPDFNCVC